MCTDMVNLLVNFGLSITITVLMVLQSCPIPQGEDGAHSVLEMLRNELIATMALTGND